MATFVFAGTFDPCTNGHLDLIHRGSALAERLIVAVAASPNKRPWFSLAQRTAWLEAATQAYPNVTVMPFTGLLLPFVQAAGAKVLLRGVRSTTDFEYERNLADYYQQVAPELETLLLMANPNYGFVSSSLMRELALQGGDIHSFVPADIATALYAYAENQS